MAEKKDKEVTTNTGAPAYADALDAMRAELLAMPEAEVERVLRLDVASAAGIAEGTAAKLVTHRASLVEEFGEAAGELVDSLPTIALATRQADVEVHAVPLSGDLSVMFEEVRTEYQLLITDATSLANRKLIDAKRLEPARDVQGYESTVRSVLVLVFVLREVWPQIKDHTPITKADLQRAEGRAQALSRAINIRDNGANRAPAIELRTRATTKLVRTYEELRRKMTYLRWYQDDVDAIIPSLWTNRGRKARSTNDERDTDTDTPSPITPSPNNGGAPFTE